MTIQKMKLYSQDASIVVDLEAENDEDTWANDKDLLAAIQSIIKCAGCWKAFRLHVVANGYTEES